MAVSLADSVDLRIILSVLYIITEVMRTESAQKTGAVTSTFQNYVDNFENELSNLY